MALDEQALIAMLRADEPRFAQIAEHLGPDDLPTLRRLVEQGDPEIATKAAGLSGRIAGPTQREVVAAGLEHDLASVRMAATRSAALLPDEQAGPLVGRALADADAGVRAVAARAAAGAGAPQLRDAVRDALGDERDPGVREAMRRALG